MEIMTNKSSSKGNAEIDIKIEFLGTVYFS